MLAYSPFEHYKGTSHNVCEYWFTSLPHDQVTSTCIPFTLLVQKQLLTKTIIIVEPSNAETIGITVGRETEKLVCLTEYGLSVLHGNLIVHKHM